MRWFMTSIRQMKPGSGLILKRYIDAIYNENTLVTCGIFISSLLIFFWFFNLTLDGQDVV